MKMKLRGLWLAILVFLLLHVSPAAGAVEVHGVTFPDQVSVDGHELRLNGAGVRTAYIFVKVYAAALYLEHTTQDAQTAIDEDETKRIVLHFLREVSQDEMNDAMREGFENTAPDTLESEQRAFHGFFSKPLPTGDVVLIDYVPAKGTTVTIGGEVEGTIAGADFMRALWGIWLGSKPADSSLKQAFLGGD